MNRWHLVLPVLFLGLALSAEVRTVDLLKARGFSVNAAGPLLVRADPPRGRIVMANTVTASLTLVDEASHRVENVPLESRTPEWLKAEALTVDERDGTIAVIGTRQVHLLRPGAAPLALDTGVQFEAVACDGLRGDLFLAGRESADLLWWQGAHRRFRRLPLGAKTEKLDLLNQTPPPPVRKVFADPLHHRLVAFDGLSRTLWTFDLRTGRGGSRTVALPDGARWHLAGWEADRGLLFLVVETAERKVLAAARIDTLTGADRIVPLPGLTEAVGIGSAPGRDLLWIPYDNHAEVQLVDFSGPGTVTSIPLPAYGNDASVCDPATGTLYIASWAYGEIEVVDLASRCFRRRIPAVGILPHMFTMAWGERSHRLYLPLGATAVNGSWGSALTVLDPASGHSGKVRTGFAPLDFAFAGPPGALKVFDSEGEVAEVAPDLSVAFHELPVPYPRQALSGEEGTIFLTYGAHQSYWPTVYIWAARNGVLTLRPDGSWDDRRLPRQSPAAVLLPGGELCGTQNNWGEEKQFLFRFPDGVRQPNLPDLRLELPDTVVREASQRLLAAAPGRRLVLARLGESDGEPGVVQLIDLENRKVVFRTPVGRTPADLLVSGGAAYVACFDDDRVWRLPLDGSSPTVLSAPRQPLRLAELRGKVYVLGHGGALAEVGGPALAIPLSGRPDGLARWGDRLVVAGHSPGAVELLAWDPQTGRFDSLLRSSYPYGDTSLDAANNSFFQRGQYADGILSITRLREAPDGRLVVSDLPSGRLFLLDPR